MDKDQTGLWRLAGSDRVSTLVLMDSWIKTEGQEVRRQAFHSVSTLVLMDSWIKTLWRLAGSPDEPHVSTLVLMDSWIKTLPPICGLSSMSWRFNPCFNGFMDKDSWMSWPPIDRFAFQPLF